MDADGRRERIKHYREMIVTWQEVQRLGRGDDELDLDIADLKSHINRLSGPVDGELGPVRKKPACR